MLSCCILLDIEEHARHREFVEIWLVRGHACEGQFSWRGQGTLLYLLKTNANKWSTRLDTSYCGRCSFAGDVFEKPILRLDYSFSFIQISVGSFVQLPTHASVVCPARCLFCPGRLPPV